MRVDSPIHKAPHESEKVANRLLILADHKVGDKPDAGQTEYIDEYSCPAVHSVDDLAHHEGANHLTDTQYRQTIKTGLQLIMSAEIRDGTCDNEGS